MIARTESEFNLFNRMDIARREYESFMVLVVVVMVLMNVVVGNYRIQLIIQK